MPLHGLPSILEVSMEQMLDTYNITSWSIRSGNKFSEVSIRFNMTADVDTETKYRKVPPSRLIRDRDRAASRIISSGQDTAIQVDLQDQGSNGSDNQEVLPLNTTALQDYCMTPIHNADILMVPVGSPSPVSQVDGIMDSKADCNGSSPLRSGEVASVNMGQETLGCNDADTCQCNNESAGSNDKCDVENHSRNVKVTQSREFACSKCKVKLPLTPNDNWHKCTHPECNIDVCKACWNTGFHSHHLRHVMSFKMPSQNVLAFCNCCGRDFDDNEKQIYWCELCENIMLCPTCEYWNSMHVTHEKHLIKMTLKQCLG